MDRVQIQRNLCAGPGIRVGQHVADYVLEELRSPSAEIGFFVMGGDARTGRPVRMRVTADIIRSEEAGRATGDVGV